MFWSVVLTLVGRVCFPRFGVDQAVGKACFERVNIIMEIVFAFFTCRTMSIRFLLDNIMTFKKEQVIDIWIRMSSEQPTTTS